MDPFVIFILTLLAVGGGGAGGAAALWRRQKRRQQMQQAVVDKVDHRGRSLSIFDVFWDLGVSEYALAIMDHHGLLLEEPEDFRSAHNTLDDHIDAHGTYTDFLEDNLEAIQEFYREHRKTGSRRKIPTMVLRHRKLLSVDRSDRGQDTSRELIRSGPKQPAPRPDRSGGDVSDEEIREELERDLGRVVQDSVEERRVQREERSPMAVTVSPEREANANAGVDVDEIVELEPMQMLQSLFEGRLTHQIQKWWKFRHLRSAKAKLDDEFETFYDYYATLASRRSDFYEMLYDTARRWRQEASRIEQLEREKPWRGEPFEDCAQALVERAATVAHQLALSAKKNVDATVERIHSFARRGDRAMAGYLLYLNHHAFFAGRAPDYGDYVQRIERQAYRVRRELRKLRREGEI